jgi:hypothetical protein
VGHLLLRHDRVARFWTLGMVISACAVAASVPGERLLLVPGVGGAALIASLIVRLWELPRSGGRLRVLARPMALTLIAVHLVAAPLSLPVRAWSVEWLGAALARADAGVPRDASIEGRTVIVLAAPFDVMLSYLQVRREAQGVPRPEHLYWLATASSPVEVERLDGRTLRVRPRRGFLLTAPERHYRGDPAALAPGTTVPLGEMTARVVDATDDGRPWTVDFTFRAPLDDPRYLLMGYADGTLRPARLPVGGRVTLPREDFFQTVLGPVLPW